MKNATKNMIPRQKFNCQISTSSSPWSVLNIINFYFINNGLRVSYQQALDVHFKQGIYTTIRIIKIPNKSVSKRIKVSPLISVFHFSSPNWLELRIMSKMLRKQWLSEDDSVLKSFHRILLPVKTDHTNYLNHQWPPKLLESH